MGSTQSWPLLSTATATTSLVQAAFSSHTDYCKSLKSSACFCPRLLPSVLPTAARGLLQECNFHNQTLPQSLRITMRINTTSYHGWKTPRLSGVCLPPRPGHPPLSLAVTMFWPYWPLSVAHTQLVSASRPLHLFPLPQIFFPRVSYRSGLSSNVISQVCADLY